MYSPGTTDTICLLDHNGTATVWELTEYLATRDILFETVSFLFFVLVGHMFMVLSIVSSREEALYLVIKREY